MSTARSEDLRRLAQAVADALPEELVVEVVLTGSVSRGVADEVSDIEMLVVTRSPLSLEECFALRAGRPAHARAPGRAARADGVAARVHHRVLTIVFALNRVTELQLETVRLAPSGPYVDRARTWPAEAPAILGAR